MGGRVVCVRGGYDGVRDSNWWCEVSELTRRASLARWQRNVRGGKSFKQRETGRGRSQGREGAKAGEAGEGVSMTRDYGR